MRKQRSGHIVTISSSAGFAGVEYGSAYAASKFGVDGWMESLAPEIAPFGIHTTTVNPGFFRSELLTNESTIYAEPTIQEYAEPNASSRSTPSASSRRHSLTMTSRSAHEARDRHLPRGLRDPPRRPGSGRRG